MPKELHDEETPETKQWRIFYGFPVDFSCTLLFRWKLEITPRVWHERLIHLHRSVVFVMSKVRNAPREVGQKNPRVAEESNQMVDPVDLGNVSMVSLNTETSAMVNKWGTLETYIMPCRS